MYSFFGLCIYLSNLGQNRMMGKWRVLDLARLPLWFQGNRGLLYHFILSKIEVTLHLLGITCYKNRVAGQLMERRNQGQQWGKGKKAGRNFILFFFLQKKKRCLPNQTIDVCSRDRYQSLFIVKCGWDKRIILPLFYCITKSFRWTADYFPHR